MRDYKKFKVWQKSHELTLKIYKVTADFPREERYGLISQIRRAAVSISTNIEEGSGRRSDTDFRRFLTISMGSAKEVEYLTFLSYELQYFKEISFQKIDNDIKEIEKMLYKFIETLSA